MAKGKPDPAVPDACLELVTGIQAVHLSEQASSSSSSDNGWSSVVQQLQPFLAEALQLTLRAFETDDYALLKSGLDALRLWSTHAASILTEPLAKDLSNRAKGALLSADDQNSLAKLIWSTCLAERTQISTRSKSLTESVILLLHRIYTSDCEPTKGMLLPYQHQALLLSNLVERSLSQLERKQSPVILEIILASYGSAPFLQTLPAGIQLTDNIVYDRIIRGLGTLDGGAARRARLALDFLSARARDLDCRLSSKSSDKEPTCTHEEYQRWATIWLGPLCQALQSGGERLRSGLASNHLVPLFELDTQVFPTLLNSLMKSEKPESASDEINVESIFLVLRTGKLQGHCRIASVEDFQTEKQADGSEQVLIPASLLEDCILSATLELQISTLSLVIESKTPAAPLSMAEFAILRTFFPYTLSITNPSARGDLRGFFVKLLTRLRASTYALERDSGKITRIEEEERYPEERKKLAELQEALSASKAFLEWMYSLLRRTLHPGASYQASITALTFLDLMLESGIDPRFSQQQSSKAKEGNSMAKNAGMSLSKSKQVFVQEFPFALDLISPSLVQLLLSCCESTYDDIQSRALTMLARFPAPLSGQEDEHNAAQRILGRAAELMTGTRDFQCAAASRLVQLYQQIYMLQLGHKPSSLLSLVGIDATTPQTTPCQHPTLQLIFNLFEFLSYHLKVAEAGDLLEAANKHPVHGALVTLQELFAPLRLADLSPSDRTHYKVAIEEAQKLIDRTWHVTKAVLCNLAPEGNTGGSAEESATDGTTGLDQPSHESARAMRLVDIDSKADFMQVQEESNAGPKHQVILSYSWRGMKEASALLGVLVTSTLSTSNAKKGKNGTVVSANSKADQLWHEVFNVDSIQGIGSRFILWLTHVRHRGAFSTIYPAFCDAVTAIVRSQAPEIQNLPREWTTDFLHAVAQPDSELSITRRSAGISYAVLALVSAQTTKMDTSVLQVTMQRLILISQHDASDPNNMPVASIHALNILRILVMDGSLSDLVSPFLGSLLELTISKFKSRYWGLRNGSMMLFSSLCIRIFGSRNTNRDVKEARMPIEDFFATFPNANQYFQQILAQEVAQETDSGEGSESSLFATLMLFSRMQAPQETPSSESLAVTLAQYTALLEKCFSHKIWKIREIAGKAYAAFVPIRSVPQHIQILLQKLRSTDVVHNNTVHGTLLAVQRLIKSVADCEAPSATLHEPMTLVNAELTKWPIRPGAYTCMVTQAALLEVVQDHAALMTKLGHPLSQEAVVAWAGWSETCVSEPSDKLAQRLLMPGGLNLLSVCTRLLLQASFDGGCSPRFIATCHQLLDSPCSDIRLSLLEALVSDDSIAESTAVAIAVPADLGRFLQSLHNVVKDNTAGIWHRTHAADLLHSFASHKGVGNLSLLSTLVNNGSQETWNALVETQHIVQLTRMTTCVPLREALLPYLADLCNLLLASSDFADESDVKVAIEDWARIVATCADDYQSVQSREAAGQSMRALGHVLFPSNSDIGDRESEWLFKARVAAINLLTDDDEDVRIEAAAMIGETISSAAPGRQGGTKKTKRAAIQRVARQGGAGSDISTDRGWTWMTHRYCGLPEEGLASLWTTHVWQELVPPQEVLNQMFEDAFSANLLLFVDEKPNQFRDPESNIRRAAAFAQDQSTSLDSNTSRSIFRRIASNLQRLQTMLKEHGTTTDPEAVHLLATRLVLGLHAITASASYEGTNTDIAQAAESSKFVAGSLGIALPAFKSQSSSSDEFKASPPGDGKQEASQPHYNIAMVSDFFYPNVGGVEGHVFFVGQRLRVLGHKVIVITHAYAPDRVGVRYLSNGIKVYYVPYQVIARQDTLPNFFALFPILRSILVREQIQIVHGHQALSSMAHEGILHARSMGLKTVFTDHSLFGFADTASILTNKLFRFALSDVDQVVCVSHTGKENTTLRGNVNPTNVSVIPNAVVAEQFYPDPGRAEQGRLTIVVLSRLMYRKGIDLLIAAIPRLCASHPDIYFLIGGDGPKRIELEQMRERFMLQDRVELCGAVRQGEVQAHLTRGTIFLNTSLTEAFGTGIIEAACAGLFVVSTRVGGVPEVLPPDMIRLARPEEDDVVRATEDAIQHVRLGRHDPWAYHAAVKSMYSWDDVAQRLQKVYERAMQQQFPSHTERISRYYAGGPIAGKIFVIIVAVDLLFLKLLQWWLPDENIDRCASFPAFTASHLDARTTSTSATDTEQ